MLVDGWQGRFAGNRGLNPVVCQEGGHDDR
jgi:hypothetical protein